MAADVARLPGYDTGRRRPAAIEAQLEIIEPESLVAGSRGRIDYGGTGRHEAFVTRRCGKPVEIRAFVSQTQRGITAQRLITDPATEFEPVFTERKIRLVDCETRLDSRDPALQHINALHLYRARKPLL